MKRDRNDWRVNARHAEPKAWAAFCRLTKKTQMADREDIYWNFFLQGWKRRARAWPFNTATGWVREAIRGS